MKVELKFEVLNTNSPEFLAILDVSNWGHKINTPSYLDITLSGTTKPVTLNWKKGEVNVIDINSLKDKCDNFCDSDEYLPDGIYSLKLYTDDDICCYEVKLFRTDCLELQMDEMLIKALNSSCETDSSIMEKLQEVNYLLSQAKSHTRLGAFSKADDFFDRAVKVIEKTANC